jgi:sulfur-carrier protein
VPFIRLPEPLSRYAGGRARFPVPGATVGEALEAAFRLYPELRLRLVDDEGRVPLHLAVFRNETAVAREGVAALAVAPDDTLTFIEAIGGGAA